MSADRRGNLEEPVLIEGEADGGGVVEGDEGGRLEDQAGHAAGLQAAPHPSLLLHINRGQSAHTKSVLWMRIQNLVLYSAILWFWIRIRKWIRIHTGKQKNKLEAKCVRLKQCSGAGAARFRAVPEPIF